MLRILLLAGMTALAAPAFAASSAWQEIAPGVTARLISSDRLSDGKTLAGLQLELPPGSTIYWHTPGETGIPTTLDFSGSTGVGSVEVHWPLPQIEQAKGYRDYVYTGSVVIPVTLEAKGPAQLALNLMLGVCSDMCVPAAAMLELAFDPQKPDAAQELRLNQALAEVPITWNAATPPAGAVRAAADGKSLTIDRLDPAVDPASLILTLEDPSVIMGAPQKGPDSALWTVPLLGGASLQGLAGRPIQFTFLTARGPYIFTGRIEASGR